jgi:hypothetical protein
MATRTARRDPGRTPGAIRHDSAAAPGRGRAQHQRARQPARRRQQARRRIRLERLDPAGPSWRRGPPATAIRPEVDNADRAVAAAACLPDTIRVCPLFAREPVMRSSWLLVAFSVLPVLAAVASAPAIAQSPQGNGVNPQRNCTQLPDDPHVPVRTWGIVPRLLVELHVPHLPPRHRQVRDRRTLAELPADDLHLGWLTRLCAWLNGRRTPSANAP